MNMQTTDAQDELFDLVDENDVLIGPVKRKDAHNDPTLIHRAVGILVFNNKGQLYLQQRSQTKDTYPGYWTVSASGHVNPGETYRQAARKELKEELGIINTTNLKLVKKILMYFPNETEYYALFQIVYSGKISPNQEEIEEGKFFTLKRPFFQNTIKNLPMTPELQYILKHVLHEYL